MGEMVMNPKDEVKFEDIKKLVNAALGKFYKNERDLIDMENNREMVSERCMVFHIGGYMKNRMNTLTKFQWADLDCEYNRDMGETKTIYINDFEYSFVPDLIIHRRKSNKNNLLVIEFKKENAREEDKEYDKKKLIALTSEEKLFKYNFGLYVELGRYKVKVSVYQNGNLCEDLSYSISY